MLTFVINAPLAVSRVTSLQQGSRRENRLKSLATLATFFDFRDPSTANQLRVRETDSPLRMTFFGA